VNAHKGVFLDFINRVKYWPHRGLIFSQEKTKINQITHFIFLSTCAADWTCVPERSPVEKIP
jgi:hypothetical protein